MDSLQNLDCPLGGQCADPRCFRDSCWLQKIADANDREIAETRAYWIKRQLQSIRPQAALRAVEEMVSEHNQAIRARHTSPHWPATVAVLTMPTAKGDAEMLGAMVAKVLTTTGQTARMQRHAIAIMVERGIQISASEIALEMGVGL